MQTCDTRVYTYMIPTSSGGPATAAVKRGTMSLSTRLSMKNEARSWISIRTWEKRSFSSKGLGTFYQGKSSQTAWGSISHGSKQTLVFYLVGEWNHKNVGVTKVHPPRVGNEICFEPPSSWRADEFWKSPKAGTPLDVMIFSDDKPTRILMGYPSFMGHISIHVFVWCTYVCIYIYISYIYK